MTNTKDFYPEDFYSEPQQPEAHAGAADDTYVDFTLLMSLALDGLLDEEQSKQFEADLALYPALAEEWQLWQELDADLMNTPAVEPPPDFMEKFEVRLDRHQRRRSLWFGVTIGLLIVLMWSSVVVGGVAVGAYILDNQGVWLGQLVHNVAYLFSVFSMWAGTLADTTATVLNMPQAWGVMLGYLALLTVILTFWTRFLRRTTQSASATDFRSIA